MKSADPYRLPVLAASQWLLTLPATLLLGAAAVRLLQPRQYEPAHTAWIIFEWASSHISRLDAGVLFIGLPAVAGIIGCATLLRTWRQDDVLQQDLFVVWDTLRRHAAVVLSTAATLASGSILCFAVVHILTD